jgi:hypothetical protein
MAAKKFDPAIPSIEALEQFAAISPGTPFPRTREAWGQLPETVRLMAESQFAELAEAHQADAGLLPADVEVRLQRGTLRREDGAALEAAGYVATAQQVAREGQAAFLEAAWAQHEQTAAQEAEQQVAIEEAWAQQQAEGAARFEAEQRSKYAARVMAGRG